MADRSIPFIHFGKILNFDIKYKSFIISLGATQNPAVTDMVLVFMLSFDAYAHIYVSECVYWEQQKFTENLSEIFSISNPLGTTS